MATGSALIPISSARFLLSTATGSGSWAFSELSNISMEVEPHEFIYCNADGSIQHTRQYGKTNPPKVTLKKPMDTDTTLWSWHLAAQAGSQNARIDCSLIAYSAGSPKVAPTQKERVFEWKLFNAWPSKVELSGLKAGATDTALVTVTLQCDMIMLPLAPPPDSAGAIPSGGDGSMA
jgi:phage tail-like protein